MTLSELLDKANDTDWIEYLEKIKEEGRDLESGEFRVLERVCDKRIEHTKKICTKGD